VCLQWVRECNDGRSGTITGTFSYRNPDNRVIRGSIARSRARQKAGRQRGRRWGQALDRRGQDAVECTRLPGNVRLCYNGAAVEQGLGWGVKPNSATRAVEEQSSAPSNPGAIPAEKIGHEDASRYCPVCSQRLESRRCKLICNVCGYYMSCADYY